MSRKLFLSHTAEASGAELALLRLTKNLSSDSVVVAFAADGSLVPDFRDAGIEVYVQASPDGTMEVKREERSLGALIRSMTMLAAYGWNLGEWIRGKDISVVVAYSVKSLLYGAVAARRARVPLVWSVHDRIAKDSFGTVNAFILRLAGWVLPDALIVNSYATLSTLWARRRRVLMLPPGVETRGSLGVRMPARELRRVAMAGRLCSWKGQMEFIEAFERVFAGTKVEAWVIGGALFGEEEYEMALRKRAGKGPCASQIRFTGAVDNVEELLRDSEIMVHASIIPEPFGAVVIEGLDAGCAVIATRPGGPAEIISDGVNGLLVPCGDVEALAGALRKLQQDGGLREALGAAGVVRARDFDVRTLAKEAEDWLSEF